MTMLQCCHHTNAHSGTCLRRWLPDGLHAHFYLLFFIFYFLSSPATAQIGTWRNYLAYHDVQQIQAATGDDIFVLASNGLYLYNKADQSITTFDKVNGLSDTGITLIRWCRQARRLVTVYNNTNIDLVETNGNIVNISDIYTKTITGDKTVNNITIDGQYAYLACGFGIVKLNVKSAEISESYIFNRNITGVATDKDYIYARITDSKSTVTGGTPVIPFHGTINLDSLINAQFSTDISTYYAKAPLSANVIDISNWEITTDDLSSLFAVDTSDYDENIQLVKTLQPGGPFYNDIGFLRFSNKTLYTCGGIIDGHFDPGISGNIQVWDSNDWIIYQNQLDTITGHGYYDLASVDVDPLDPSHVFAAGRTGLYEFRNRNFVKEYNYHNSPLKTTAALDHLSKNYTMVETVKYDDKGNLWLINSGSATTSIFEITKDGEWIDHHHKAFLNSGSRTYDNVVNATFDSNGILWCCNDRFVEPALLYYNPQTNEARAFTNFINQDGTISGVVRCVSSLAEDKEGNIWIGTNIGPFMFEKSQWNEENPYFTQVKIPRNDGTNYADYLLSGSHITAIAVDGGGRKWFGTLNDGVYLVSADNMVQIQHFTEDNSELLSNTIYSIAIDHTTGNVFFGTQKGICSYISDATETSTKMTTDNVWAYPNPVTPSYTGLITITGLTYDADVKIITANGALVNKGRSNGGTYIWDGNDMKGRRVASGIYMVVTATNTGEKGTVCKIAVIR